MPAPIDVQVSSPDMSQIYGIAQDLAGYLDVVEWNRSFARDLYFLMTLARDQNNVARSSLADSQGDCHLTIRLYLVLCAGTLQAYHGVVDNRQRIFATRIV